MRTQMSDDPIAHCRSILCCPADSTTKLARAAASPADGILLDLEDAVAPTEKVRAREALLNSLARDDYGARALTVRINDLDSPHWKDDVRLLLEPATRQVSAICVPKVWSPRQLETLDRLLSKIERETGRDRPVRLQLLIEDVRALERLYELARGPRVSALVFGPGDFSTSMGVRRIPDLDPRYDPLLLHRAAVLTVARATDVAPVDGPSTDLSGGPALRQDCAIAAAAGYIAKWAIHPAQLACINTMFAPSPAEIEQATRIVSTVANQSVGVATTNNGEFIDHAIVNQARSLLARAQSRHAITTPED